MWRMAHRRKRRLLLKRKRVMQTCFFVYYFYVLGREIKIPMKNIFLFEIISQWGKGSDKCD